MFPQKANGCVHYNDFHEPDVRFEAHAALFVASRMGEADNGCSLKAAASA
jgi:hypothetical protein